MRNPKFSAQRGFTLIELMIVVAIIGILASVAIPLFMDSMKKAKKSEAMVSLDKIGKKAAEAYVTNASYPAGTAATTPGASCCTQNVGGKRRCLATAVDWSTPEWRALDFSMDKDFYFQYAYTPGAGIYAATAVGDLDCDGTQITYTINGTTLSGSPSSSITEPPPNSD